MAKNTDAGASPAIMAAQAAKDAARDEKPRAVYAGDDEVAGKALEGEGLIAEVGQASAEGGEGVADAGPKVAASDDVSDDDFKAVATRWGLELSAILLLKLTRRQAFDFMYEQVAALPPSHREARKRQDAALDAMTKRVHRLAKGEPAPAGEEA